MMLCHFIKQTFFNNLNSDRKITKTDDASIIAANKLHSLVLRSKEFKKISN